MDLGSALRRSATFNADREAIVAGTRRVTFAEAWDRGLRLANGLLGAGLEPQDRVGVLDANDLGACDAFVGLAAANLVRVPVYPNDSPDRYLHMLGRTGCRALLVSGAFASSVEGLAERLPDLRFVLVRDDTYDDWLAGRRTNDPNPDVDPDDLAIIRHTSGTTGLPKGVPFSHRAWLATARDWFYPLPPVNPGDRCLHLGPISHGTGYIFTPVWMGAGSSVLLNGFDADACLELMERERIGYTFMLPSVVAALLSRPTAATRDWSHLKALIVGGEPLTEAQAYRARDVFGDVLHQIYGATEAVPATFMGPTEWFSTLAGSTPLRSAGRPYPFASVRILDARDADVPIGEIGEIVIRTDGQTGGYWQDEIADKDLFVNGFVRTGDVGRLDVNGYLYVVARKDDGIVVDGMPVWPAEIENTLSLHPGVAEVGAFGEADDDHGQLPVAVCVTAAGAAVTGDDLATCYRKARPEHRHPLRIVVTADPLPHTSVGKLDRRTLADRYRRA